jgi:hypothetical protein
VGDDPPRQVEHSRNGKGNQVAGLIGCCNARRGVSPGDEAEEVALEYALCEKLPSEQSDEHWARGPPEHY